MVFENVWVSDPTMGAKMRPGDSDSVEAAASRTTSVQSALGKTLAKVGVILSGDMKLSEISCITTWLCFGSLVAYRESLSMSSARVMRTLGWVAAVA